MSTRIFTAYRFQGKAKDLMPWVRVTRRKAEQEVKKALRDLYAQLSSAVNTDSEEYKKHVADDRSDERARLYMVQKLIREQYKEQATSPYRDLFNFDVSIAIREHKGKFYLIPHCDTQMRDVLNFLKKDPQLTDFSYWNNTDHPEHIPYAEWQARGRIWDAIDKAGWLDYLALDIVTWNGFWQIDPFFDLLKEQMEREKAART